MKISKSLFSIFIALISLSLFACNTQANFSQELTEGFSTAVGSRAIENRTTVPTGYTANGSIDISSADYSFAIVNGNYVYTVQTTAATFTSDNFGVVQLSNISLSITMADADVSGNYDENSFNLALGLDFAITGSLTVDDGSYKGDYTFDTTYKLYWSMQVEGYSYSYTYDITYGGTATFVDEDGTQLTIDISGQKSETQSGTAAL